jgi:hypothetical protein
MLTFDAASHTYFWQGRRVPNVTRILDEVVVDFSRVDRQTLLYAQRLGTAVHKACELDDLGDLVEESVSPVVRPYLEAYRRFKRECSPHWDAIEEKVFHRVHQFAGTLDRRGEVFGARAILDIKSGIEHPAVAMQTSAYLQTHCDDFHISPIGWKRFALYLRDDGTYCPREIDKTPHVMDFRDFLSALNVYRWKERHNLLPKENECPTT